MMFGKKNPVIDTPIPSVVNTQILKERLSDCKIRYDLLNHVRKIRARFI